MVDRTDNLSRDKMVDSANKLFMTKLVEIARSPHDKMVDSAHELLRDKNLQTKWLLVHTIF